MRVLPFDYVRCIPTEPDQNCHNCKRWYHHPEQANGEFTSIQFVIKSTDPGCIYIPVSLLGKPH